MTSKTGVDYLKLTVDKYVINFFNIEDVCSYSIL